MVSPTRQRLKSVSAELVRLSYCSGNIHKWLPYVGTIECFVCLFGHGGRKYRQIWPVTQRPVKMEALQRQVKLLLDNM